MELNLPVLEKLSHCQNLLIAGIGGGFDVFCGLPIYFELRRKGNRVHLANFSFSDVRKVRGGIRLSETLVGVGAGSVGPVLYFPELHLAEWFRREQQEEVLIWCFQKTGAGPLTKNYRLLVEHLVVDAVLLVDGGVDSLARGDETAPGTLIEDATSLFAVNQLKELETRLVACLGMGAEEHVAHAQILENIAGLSQEGGFLGACALTPQMECYQSYERAVLAVQGRKYQEPSVINSSIVSAVQGHFGDYHMTNKTHGSLLWISPLMGLYWFFDLVSVCRRNLYLERLEMTETFMDAMTAYAAFASNVPKRRSSGIGLS
jgi:hypothetical protein